MTKDSNITTNKKDIRTKSALAHRQILINEAIEKGSFNSRDHLKQWMKSEFGLNQPVEEISTEHTLTDNQMRLFYKWLLHFTGRGKRPVVKRASSLVTKKQLWRINELTKALQWSNKRLSDFIVQQCQTRKLPGNLFKTEATKIITGMERILAELPVKSN